MSNCSMAVLTMLKLIIFCSLFLVAFCKPLQLGNSDNAKRICGISPALERYGRHNTDKIIEGNVSRPGDWPWMVSLNWGDKYECASTLISDKWILTAAHCVYRTYAEIRAFAGSNTRSVGKELVVEASIYHPLYKHDDPTSYVHDIALIQVSKVTFSDTVKPICLSSKLKHSPNNDTIGVGWGMTWDGQEIEETYVLREDFVPIEPWKHCDVSDDDTDPKTEICAGSGMHSAYVGDSGGPLKEIVNNRFYEIGVTSRGGPASNITDHTDFEDIYTFVPAYCDWIFETTNGDVKCE